MEKLNNLYNEFLSNEYESLSPSEKYDYFMQAIVSSINYSNPKKNNTK